MNRVIVRIPHTPTEEGFAMRRATGPATVEDAVAPSGAPLGGAAVSLSNFDFDDATVKPEHQTWLRTQAVPRLAPPARIFLRGMASKVGNADYNRKLSRRRVDAVKAFLVSAGVNAGQIVTDFTGEDLSTSTNPDDPRDRAVIAVFEFPPSLAPIFVQGVLGDTLDGFDDRPTVPTQVVPFEGPRDVRLVAGRGCVIESLDTTVVRVQDPAAPARTPVVATSSNFTLRLQPALNRTADVVARDLLGREVARLSVTVLPNKSVSVFFHYMQGTIATTRTRDAAKENGFIRVMNRIYNRQANITFTRSGNGTATEATVVGPEVRTDLATLSGDWPPIVAHRTADRFNIFFVKVLEVDTVATTDSIDGITQIGGNRDCIFEDPDANDPGDANDGETLAHEAGHAFGELDDTNNQNLLFGTTHARGRLIPANQAGRMNANLP